MAHEAGTSEAPLTAAGFQARKGGAPLVCVTAYDAPFAQLAEQAGVDGILVGDSLGPSVLGYDRELHVTVEDIVHHAAAVTRAASAPLVIGDMPFMSYATLDDALHNAARLVRDGGVAAVKLEGGPEVAAITAGLTARGIPVMAHVGLTPQSVLATGGYLAQGVNLEGAQRVVDGARAQEAAGAFAVVLEAIPARLAAVVTERLAIPTIGIGAGPNCDGQIQVLHDLLGLASRPTPRHTHRYADVAGATRNALMQYRDEVTRGAFPTTEHGFKIRRGVIDRLSFD